MPKVFIGVGSNLGDREGHFEFARRELLNDEAIRELKLSPVCETDPVDVEGGKFLNAVWRFETDLSAQHLLKKLRGIEQESGRVRGEKPLARTLDLDLLIYGDQVIRDEELTVPHPRLFERTFVLKPFCDLDPEWVHPVLKKTIKELWSKLQGVEHSSPK